MNLVEVATWIQEADRNWHLNNGGYKRDYYIVGYVMRKGRGHFNPVQIKELVDMEDSYNDGTGMKLCCSGSCNECTCNKPKDDSMDGMTTPFRPL